MIDLFSLGLTHVLIAIACWRLVLRADLDLAGEDAAASAKERDAEPGAPKAGKKPPRA